MGCGVLVKGCFGDQAVDLGRLKECEDLEG